MVDESLSVPWQWESNVLVINTLPTDVAIEKTIPFLRLVAIFNQTEKTKYDVMDVLESWPIFRKFYDFVFHNIIKHKIVIQEELAHVLMSKIEDLRLEYQQDDMEKWRDKIFDEVLRKEWLSRKDDYTVWARKKFRRAWIDMEDDFHNDKRRTLDENNKPQDTFTHLTWTMEILFDKILPNMPSWDDVHEQDKIPKAQWLYLIIISLLHDAVEKDPRIKKILRRDFGPYVAKWVVLLSKKKLEGYIANSKDKHLRKNWTQAEKETIERATKKRRNHDYFKDLSSLDIWYLAVKLADRIHNLTTMRGEPLTDIKRKIAETKKYFLIPDIQKRIKIWYDIIEEKVHELELEYDL